MGDALGVWALTNETAQVVTSDATFLLHESSRQPVILRGSAHVCWDKLMGATTDRAVDILSDAYARHPYDIRPDVEALVAQLLEADLIRTVQPDPPTEAFTHQPEDIRERHPDAEHPDALPLQVAVELMTARIGLASPRIGIDALVIKGRPAGLQCLRSDRVSSDVDVLIRPSHYGRFEEYINQMGWNRRPDDLSDDVFPRHSLSFYSSQWPCDIDAHWRWPGFGASDEAAFEAIWKHRTSLAIAGIDVLVPDVTAHTVILALNALRAPWSTRATADRLRLQQTAEELPSHDAFLEVIRDVDAGNAITPFLEDIGLAQLTRPTSRQDPNWPLYTQGPQSAAIRWVALRQARPRDWPRMLQRAVFPSRTALASRDLSVLTMSSRELMGMRIRRLQGALRALPHIAQGVRTYNRARASHNRRRGR